ncbi:chromo domain-containing protein cec-1-like [Palaemon carinicauda]|uniref:chromo domain-containing protein cec-1-like n=1 Tax=Palaemon carinicauda TaxID=392227 RepID=UPI0035B59BF3
MNVTGAFSNLGEDPVDKKKKKHFREDVAEVSVSDGEEEKDQIEVDVLYNSDEDKDYFTSFSEQDEEPEDVEIEKGKKNKQKQTSNKTILTSTPKKEKNALLIDHTLGTLDGIPSTSSGVTSPALPKAAPNNAASNVDTTAKATFSDAILLFLCNQCWLETWEKTETSSSRLSIFSTI